MEKEFIRTTKHSVTLNVTGGKIDSFRELEKTNGTVRVYENGCIGIAGCLGEPNEEELTAKAVEALAFGIPYPADLGGPLELEEIHNEEEIIPVPQFIPTMQAFLDRLQELCPKFAFSNKIYLMDSRTEYRNSAGRHLTSAGRMISIELIVQNRGSGNLFDTALAWEGSHFDADTMLALFKKQYDAFYTPVDLEPGRYPVVADPSSLIGRFAQHFVGDLYAVGASLLSGKLGEKVFSDKLSFRDDRNPETSPATCFFDAEGCAAENYRPTLVENGVLKGLLTTKKTAKQYGLSNLGTASAAYDGVPDLNINRIWFEPTAGSLKELVPGKAVFIIMASGGDATPDGHFATPVQMSYLLEDGEIVGRLPDLSVSGDFFDMFGKDYIGAVKDDPQEGILLSAVMMDVTKG